MTSASVILAVGGQRTVNGLRERRVLTPTTVSDERYAPEVLCMCEHEAATAHEPCCPMRRES